MNGTPMEVSIPTFVNPHLFWIIEKRQFLIRAAIDKLLSRRVQQQEIKEFHKIRQSTIVAVWVDGIWARARVHRVINRSDVEPGFNKDSQYLCWLIDYGVMRLQNTIFYLPGDLKNIAPIAKQASLLNVVSLTKEWSSLYGANFTFDMKKTAGHVEGTRNISLELLEKSNTLYFSVSDQDEFTLYGDILFVTAGQEEKQSLTKYMLDHKLMEEDKELFQSIDASRTGLIEEYYKGSQRWSKPLDKVINKDEIFFNTEENTVEYMEYFARKNR